MKSAAHYRVINVRTFDYYSIYFVNVEDIDGNEWAGPFRLTVEPPMFVDTKSGLTIPINNVKRAQINK